MQEQIMELLEKAERPLSRGEIAKLLDADPTNISHKIRVLLKYGEIKFVEVGRKEAIKNYNCFRRMKLYYV